MGSKVVPDGSGARASVIEYRGPVKDRSCTDVFCLIIFIAFLVGWGIVGYFALTLGDPQRIIHPTDSQGRMCGLHESVRDKPYLFFFDLAKCANPSVLTYGCPTPQVCVANCPGENFLAIEEAVKIGETKTKEKIICKENVTVGSFTVKQLVDQGLCAAYYMQSKPITNRCIPSVPLNDETAAKINNATRTKWKISFDDILSGTKMIGYLARFTQYFESVCMNMSQVWWIIVLMMMMAAVLSLTWIVLMKYIAGVMVWLSIVVVMVLQAVGIWYCYNRYDDLKRIESNVTMADVAFSTQIDNYLSVKETWLAFLILLGISAAIVLFTVIFLRNRISIAVALIKQGSRAVNDMLSSITFPIFPWVFQVLFLGYFFVLLAYNFSIGQSTYKVVGPENSPINCSCPLVIDQQGTCSPIAFSEICGKQCPGAVCQFVQFGGNKNYTYILQGYNLFGLFWALFFIGAFEELVLAKAFASWYWTFKKPDDLPSVPILKGVYIAFRYHLGTIAFGSLIIAIIRSIRVILEYVDRKIKQYQDNCCSKCLMWTCKCCFWLLEKFMRFVNRNAYIMCAVTGKNFCSSASEAFGLLLRNVVRVVVLDKITDVLLFLGRLVVLGAVAVASYYAFSVKLGQVEYYLVPMITSIIGAYFVTGLFFNVYAMAIDTLFLCFLHDSEINDGSPERPYYMPVGLMEIIGKKNKQSR